MEGWWVFFKVLLSTFVTVTTFGFINVSEMVGWARTCSQTLGEVLMS